MVECMWLTGGLERLEILDLILNFSRGVPVRMQVDLSLAINYLPACTCLSKMVGFMTLMILIHPGVEIEFYPIIAFILYMDRLVSHNIIFDSNSILLAVFFSNAHQLVRSMAPVANWGFPVFVLHIMWVGLCTILIVEPPFIVRWMERKSKWYTLIPSLVMVVVLSFLTFIKDDIDSPLIKFCRAIAFNLLCLIWIYLIGVNNTHSIEYLKDTSAQFISRMAPVLYSPIWISGVFCMASILALVYQYINLTKNVPVYQSYTKPDPIHSPTQEIVGGNKNDTMDAESGEVYELFKMAKQGGRLGTITE